MVGRSAGAPTPSWTCRPAATSTTRANGSCACAGADRHRADLPALEKVGGDPTSSRGVYRDTLIEHASRVSTTSPSMPAFGWPMCR